MDTHEHIETELVKLRLPVQVRHWRVERGENSTGDAAVWVWVTLDDEDLVEDNREAIRQAVRAEVRRVAEPMPGWVYVRFRGTSEDAA